MNADFLSPTPISGADNFGAARIKETRTHYRAYGDVRTSRSEIIAAEFGDVFERMCQEMGDARPNKIKMGHRGKVTVSFATGVVWEINQGGIKSPYVKAKVIARISGAMVVTEII